MKFKICQMANASNTTYPGYQGWLECLDLKDKWLASHYFPPVPGVNLNPIIMQFRSYVVEAATPGGALRKFMAWMSNNKSHYWLEENIEGY